VDPNTKKITRFGRYWMFFGVALLLTGLFLILLLPLKSPYGSADLAVFGGVLAVLGALSVCVRFGVIVDRQRRTITTWWGPVIPFSRTEHPFSQSHHVTLSREEREAGAQTYEVFPVRLEGPGTGPITLQEPRDHDKARKLAEEIAKFAHLGIRDRSSGQEVAREAGALDESLRQRSRRAGRFVALPAQPPGAVAMFHYGGNGAPTTIEIPPAGRSARWFLLVAFIAGFVTAFAELFMWLEGHEEELDIGFRAVLVFLLILGFFLPLPLRTAILRERLVVSPDELVVTRRDIFGTRTTRLMGSEVEEVEVTHAGRGMYGGYETFRGGPNRVVIRSDCGSLELGAAIPKQEELQWLRDVVVHVLTADSPGR
jgi:hypothetical protein